MTRLHVLVMAGGSGTRFWPQSRHRVPKQFLSLTGARSLIQETVMRVESLCPRENVWILTRADLESQVRKALPGLAAGRIICEPEGRDTAPCLVLGSVHVERVDPEAAVLVLPADHVIRDVEKFSETVRAAIVDLEEGNGLVTFGIPPTHAATGYGYIRRRDGEGARLGATRVYGVESFEEKPDEPTARAYVEDGCHYWNSGIFLWKLSAFATALAEHAPELWEGWERLREGLDADQGELGQRFRELPRISIDYALMEKAQNVRVVEAPFEWDDVGSWRALERYRDPDPEGNITEGKTVLADTRRSTVLAAGGRVVAALGLEEFLVVDTPDALLICPRKRVEEVKTLVDGARCLGWEDVL